ncbi:hypothetical protein DFR67_12635 [Williamsia limnetica]|uniref:Uncharacterized protein n=1 Tax=Williamsia limnetica TaxID=882452 RepID=A0A318RGC0_WILLI|nr:hypothetical protein [Williamsia limnetica]PYE12027.1 hypothetical protein DFR67_12635 [Williamsia limnetica]
MSTAESTTGSEQSHAPLPLPWEAAMTVAAMGFVVAVLVRCIDLAARTSDGAAALALSRLQDSLTTAAHASTGPVVMTLLAVVGAAVAVVGPILSCRLVLGAWPGAGDRPGLAAIAAGAAGAAGVFAAVFLYTAVISTMTAPSIPAAAGAEVCAAIAAMCAWASRRQREPHAD